VSLPDDDSRLGREHLQEDRAERAAGTGGEGTRTMTQTKLTIAALIVGFTIAALIVLSAITMGAVAGT
jgi:hypothetical protein